MRLSLAFSLVPLAISVGALSVTEPKKGVEIDPSTSFDVKWTSVDTDASSFDIYIVNNAVYPPVNKKIASNIKTSSDSYTVDSVDVSAGHGYQIDLMSDATENTGILAQSQQFNVTSSAQSSSTSSTSTSTSTKESSTKGSTTGTMMTTTSTGISTGTSTGASTGTSTGTAGMTTTPAASGTPISGSSTSMAANGTSSAAPTASTGAGAALVAHPVIAAGLFAGAVAFAL